MSPDKDKELCKKFPLLYRDRNLDKHSHRETLMPYGFSCGDGWFQLIYDLSEQLEAIIVRVSRKERAKNYILGLINKLIAPIGLKPFEIRETWPKAFQVKEKFGGLRFYMSDFTKEMQKLIGAAEEKSYSICMRCGATGSLRTNRSWWTTSCDACFSEKLRCNY